MRPSEGLPEQETAVGGPCGGDGWMDFNFRRRNIYRYMAPLRTHIIKINKKSHIGEEPSSSQVFENIMACGQTCWSKHLSDIEDTAISTGTPVEKAVS
ncbi:hypothetical protein E2C01_094995 [Portunus trituberculatus]|uniref:Uncharacterized protein n=1 Tax=Portunus trituberculatus TaxID=210409 RepID=A0A5B7JTZ4_PORTR|nr:hypothetical protein [Portunus trituberculatus]